MLPISYLVQFALPEMGAVPPASESREPSPGPGDGTHAGPAAASDEQSDANEELHGNNDIQGWKLNSRQSGAVFRLPSEVLGCIFRIMLDAHLEALDARRTRLIHHCRRIGHFPDELPKLPTPPWIVLLQVSRQWRAAAMGYAGLWTHVYDMDPGRLKQFASLSSRLSLDFEIRLFGMPHDSQVVALSNRFSDRVRSLSLLAPNDFPMFHVIEFLRNFLGHRASRLRSLDLMLFGQPRAEAPCEPLFLGENGLFAGRVSHLQALSIYCPHGAFVLQINCPVFRTLQYLSVISTASWQTSSTSHFMSCLQTWTELRELHLHFGLPTDLNHDLSSFLPPIKYHSPINLLSIKRLHLADHVRYISNFMARVSLHPSAVLHLEFMVFDESSFEEANTVRRMAAANLVAQVLELAGAPPVHLEFSCGVIGDAPAAPDAVRGKVEVAVSTVPIPDDEDDDDDDDEEPAPQFTFVLLSLGDIMHTVTLQLALDTFELSHVQTLALDATEAHFLADWAQVLPRLQNLRDLRVVEAQRAGRFFEALDTPVSPGRACLPNLESMYLSARSMHRSMFSALVKALKTRMDLGSPLRVLRIVMDLNRPLGARRKKALACVVESVGFETADLDFKEEDGEDGKDADSEASTVGA